MSRTANGATDTKALQREAAMMKLEKLIAEREVVEIIDLPIGNERTSEAL